MTLSEAVGKARWELYNYEENAELLEYKTALAYMIRERGSRTEQQYGERPGRRSARYVDSVPAWLQETEDIERQAWGLYEAASTVRSMTAYLRDNASELYGLYVLKYRDKAALPTLRNRYGGKLKKLDMELIYTLIYWHCWRIEDGENYFKWLDKRGFGGAFP
jgi:hypothetical protein